MGYWIGVVHDWVGFGRLFQPPSAGCAGHPARTRTRLVPRRKSRSVFTTDDDVPIAAAHSLAGTIWWKGIGHSFSLNLGPWNIKEHALVYIMANGTVRDPYTLNAIVVAEVLYNVRRGFQFNLVTDLATQLTGFGLAGLCRRFLIWPASIVWP